MGHTEPYEALSHWFIILFAYSQDCSYEQEQISLSMHVPENALSAGRQQTAASVITDTFELL